MSVFLTEHSKLWLHPEHYVPANQQEKRQFTSVTCKLKKNTVDKDLMCFLSYTIKGNPYYAFVVDTVDHLSPSKPVPTILLGHTNPLHVLLLYIHKSSLLPFPAAWQQDKQRV